ncbi:MAG: hypothetical protein U0736_08270 [Gemmataceae bacterium]
MDQRPWHRLFGLSWADFCEGSALEVRPETDLSVKQQFVDLVLVRQGSGQLPQPLPDGFDDLATHNLVTFKSHQEALDGWALCELVGHYVNHRKQSSPSLKDLLPEADFRLYAVCVRYPHNLAQVVPLTSVQEGVYEVPALGRRIRIVVVQQLPQADHNALLHLFSTRVEQVQYARQHYQPRSRGEMTTLFYELLRMYDEDPTMSELLKEYARERMKELLKDVPPEKRLEGLSPKQRLEGLSPGQWLEGLSREELRAVVEEAQRRLQNSTSPPNS